MVSTSPAFDVPTSAVVDLARTRDDLLHWVRLRALWGSLRTGSGPGGDGVPAELDRMVAAARPAAHAHLARLAAFYDDHAEAVDALVGRALEGALDARMKERLRAAGPDFAATAAARARALVESASPEVELCGALAAMQEEADVACIRTGDPGDCAYATLVALLTDQHC
jgi:hypothetical protein